MSYARLEYWYDPIYEPNRAAVCTCVCTHHSTWPAALCYHIIAEYFSGLHKSCYIGREHTLLHQNVSVDSQVLFSDESMIDNSIPQWE